MLSQENGNSLELRVGAIAGIGVLLFLPGVVLQMLTGWFPTEALQNGDMEGWLQKMVEQQSLALLGVGFSILAIILFLPFGLALYRYLSHDYWQTHAARIGSYLGATLALVAFTFGFGFTRALAVMGEGASADTLSGLTALADMSMRAFLAGDDLATTLIGISNALFAWVGLKTGKLPKWLGWWGIIAGILVCLALLQYIFPTLVIASIGYPMVILWFGMTGITLMRKQKTLVSPYDEV